MEDTPLPHTLAKPRSCFFSSLPCVVAFLRSWVPPAPLRPLPVCHSISPSLFPALALFSGLAPSSPDQWSMSMCAIAPCFGGAYRVSSSRHTRRRSAGAAAGSVSSTSSTAAAWRHQRRLLRHTDVRAHVNTSVLHALENELCRLQEGLLDILTRLGTGL